MNEKLEKNARKKQRDIDPMNFAARFLQHPSIKTTFIGHSNLEQCLQNKAFGTLYKWKRCTKKKCCKQSGQVKFMGTMTKWHTQNITKHGVYKDATDIKK